MMPLTYFSFGHLPLVSHDAALGDQVLRAAGEALTKQDDRWPARRVLDASEGDWALRDHQIRYLAGRRGAGAAFEAWAEAEPEDADVLTGLAFTEVTAAWRARGAGLSPTVRESAWPVFLDRLGRADRLLGRAAGLAPDNPGPRALALVTARGLQVSRREFDTRWASLTAVDPDHRYGHHQALQYLAAKWYGSHEEMFAFARAAAERVPDGHPLVLLPLLGQRELLLGDPEWCLGRQFGQELTDCRRRWFDATPLQHPRIAEDHSLLAALLSEAGRHAEAAAHFRAMGRHASTYGWQYWSAPRTVFRRNRGFAARVG
ncbi:hypothetical protein ACIRBX_32215 [Kitasatospora sp. NPDC096147]|uniref:hypothetical protein n=1 Tax=Kitasatospora sp. NPDC096147 TaxID=3364093 RepID=UPI0037F384A8